MYNVVIYSLIYSVAPPKELKGALEPNFHLEGAERLLEGRIYGPECLIVRNNEIYTGIHGGEIIKLTANHVTHVAKFGQPCGKFQSSRNSLYCRLNETVVSL